MRELTEMGFTLTNEVVIGTLWDCKLERNGTTTHVPFDLMVEGQDEPLLSDVVHSVLLSDEKPALWTQIIGDDEDDLYELLDAMALLGELP